MSTNIPSLPNNISDTQCGYPESFECMICLEKLSDSLSSNVDNTLDDVRDFSLCCEIDCLHVFHRSCLEQWFALEKKYCPCCNEQQINISDSVRPAAFRTESEYTILIRKRFDELIELRRIMSEQDNDDMPELEPPHIISEEILAQIERWVDARVIEEVLPAIRYPNEDSVIHNIINILTDELRQHNQDDMDAHFNEGNLLNYRINILQNFIHY